MVLALVLVLGVIDIMGFVLQAPNPSKVTSKLLYKTVRQ